jgi:hypothetical protein
MRVVLAANGMKFWTSGNAANRLFFDYRGPPWHLNPGTLPASAMRSFGRHTFWRPIRRRLTAGLSLAAYVTATFGFPLPALPAQAPKDREQRYPCENHPCGCGSAEQCWRHCCCFSPEERWAWARGNGVEPPAYAQRPAVHGWRTTRLRDQARQQSCPVNCHRSTNEENPSACDATREPANCGQAGPSAKSKPAGSVHWVLGVTARKCRGTSSQGLSSGAVLPPPPRVTWTPWLIATDWVSCSQGSVLVVCLTPPDPPPRQNVSTTQGPERLSVAIGSWTFCAPQLCRARLTQP